MHRASGASMQFSCATARCWADGRLDMRVHRDDPTGIKEARAMSIVVIIIIVIITGDC